MKFINHNGKRWSQEFKEGYNVIHPCIDEQGNFVPEILVYRLESSEIEIIAAHSPIGALKVAQEVIGRELSDYSDTDKIEEIIDWSKTVTPLTEQTIEEYMQDVFKPTYIASYD